MATYSLKDKIQETDQKSLGGTSTEAYHNQRKRP